jgi:hypothetical protein
VVEKIWNFEVSGLILWIFSEAKDLSGIIFQIQGPFCEITDYGFIIEKHKGLSIKSPGI